MCVKPSLFVIFIICLCSYHAESQYLKTDGTRIVDNTGNDIIWRGMGLGGWMLQEGYMLQTSGPQHVLESRIDELVGEESRILFYDAWLNNHTTKIDVDSLASWGFNSIRLPMHYKLFTPPIEEEPIPGEITWRERGFEMTDQLLAWCKANNIYLILDLHAAPGGQGENADISDYDLSKPSLWESELNKAKTIALWGKLAERYADEPMIAAYDLLNETNWGFQNHEADPNGCSDTQSTPLWDLQKDITAAIRRVDKNHIIVIEGNCWGGRYDGLPTLWDDNVVISYHKYWNGNTQNDIQGMLNMRVERNVPIWLGETGENSNTWFANCVDLLERNNVGWAWWPLKKVGLNAPMEVTFSDEYRKIVDYWNDDDNDPATNPKPSKESALAALMNLSEGVKLENSTYHKDIVDALMRQPHSTETIPFTNHEIKADKENIISASDYDLGKNGYAYYDLDTANYHGSTGSYTAWNAGWSYRNDGVDMEASTDSDTRSNGYNVGWTHEGEWMQYTISVDSTAAYLLEIRYANLTDGAISIEVDGVQATGVVELPASGGYQSWQSNKIEDIVLHKGVHQLRVIIERDEVNLGFFSLLLTKSISEVLFRVTGAKTNVSGSAIELDLNLHVDSISLEGSEGFKLVINGEGEVPNVFYISREKIGLDVIELLHSNDEITVDYDGVQVISTVGSRLQTFSNLSVINIMPKYISIPGKIEAEDFFDNHGLQLENTTDLGGGLNIGYTNSGDYLDYRVNVEESGNYLVELRIACLNNAGMLSILQLDSEGEVINASQVEVPVTGGWQDWETIKARMNLDQGPGILRMEILDPEFNVNWMKFSAQAIINGLRKKDQGIFYPNPSKGYLYIDLPSEYLNQHYSLRISDLNGKEIFTRNNISIAKGLQINIGNLPVGLYIMEFKSKENTWIEKLLIE